MGRPGARTLTIDCGGTGLKAAVVDIGDQMLSACVRVSTPYPCPPERLVDTLAELVAPLPAYDRVSVGLPGIIRAGRVLTTPHYVTAAGPFTARRDDLVAAWTGCDIASALELRLGHPVRAANDAVMHGLAVVSGQGFEVMMTLGTGLGFAMYFSGQVLPKVEMSAHPLRKGQTYDERLGDLARQRIGPQRWNKRVAGAIATLRPVFWWERLYLGGGNARRLTIDLGDDVTIVPNAVALIGGVRLWQVDHEHGAARSTSECSERGAERDHEHGDGQGE